MTATETRAIGLKKALGFWTLLALAVGAVVGDGIFTFTGYGVASSGPSIIFVYIGVGILQLFLMISFGELVVWKPTAGGPEVWVRKLVSWDWGAVASLMFSFGWILAGGTTGLAIGAYTNNFFTHLGVNLTPTSLWITAFAIGWVSVFAYLNIRGVGIAAGVQTVLVFFLVGSVVAFAAAVTPHVEKANYLPLFPFGFGGMVRAIPVVAYAFVGASTVLFAAEEARRPIDVARVLLWSSIIITVVYSWALFAAVGVLKMDQVQKFIESIYVTAASNIYGAWFANVLNVSAWTAAATCLLMGTIYQPPRDLYNLARTGYSVPRWFGSLHPRYQTPVRNTLLIWAIAVVLIVSGQVWGQTTVYQLLGYELVWAWCVSWLLTLLAALNFRRHHASEAAALPWRVPLWPLTPIIGAAGLVVTLYALFQDLWTTYGATTCIVFALVSVIVVGLLRIGIARIKPSAESRAVLEAAEADS
jgi:amino acid transporter